MLIVIKVKNALFFWSCRPTWVLADNNINLIRVMTYDDLDIDKHNGCLIAKGDLMVVLMDKRIFPYENHI